MKINDGAFVAARDGCLVLGHVDRPFDLWQADPGILILLAEVARGTSAEELTQAISSVVTSGEPAVNTALARLRQAGVIVDEPQAALRDVQVEVAKAVSATPDLNADDDFMKAARQCEGLTLTSPSAQYALWSAVRHLVLADIPGALVECGVWRGGSMLLSALALLGLGAEDRDLYLFDTFNWRWEQAGDHDGFVGLQQIGGQVADAGSISSEQMSSGAAAEQVYRRIAATGYPAERINCVAGLVQQTVPAQAPEHIALLRLDTDQYDSTLHELRELYPRVVPGGVVIIDDYGKLAGATQATDEYLAELQHLPLLHRLDTQGRIFLKPR